MDNLSDPSRIPNQHFVREKAQAARLVDDFVKIPERNSPQLAKKGQRQVKSLRCLP